MLQYLGQDNGVVGSLYTQLNACLHGVSGALL